MSPDACDHLRIRGAKEHNLRSVDLDLPRDSIIVITGLSGSGKSSLAFDTIYAEGQRRYMESLSSYARQFLDQMPRPRIDEIDGLSPAISIEQKTVSRNPRSTVGTVTEIYDFLRILFANVGQPHCPSCAKPVEAQTADQIRQAILNYPKSTKLLIMAPIVRGRKGEYRQELTDALRMGYNRAKVDGEHVLLDEGIPALKRNLKHDISIVVDRLSVGPESEARIQKAVETALRMAEGLLEVENYETGELRAFSRKFACGTCGTSIEEITHRIFSFNSPAGACSKCDGLGTILQAEESLLIPDPDRSLGEGALAPWAETLTTGSARRPTYEKRVLQALAAEYRFSLDTPWHNLPTDVQRLILEGTKGPINLPTRSSLSSTVRRRWIGIKELVEDHYREHRDDHSLGFLREVPCPLCFGSRLNPTALSVRLQNHNIADLCTLDVTAALQFLENLELNDRQQAVASIVMKEILDRLRFLDLVGLGYLNLNRRAGTLSGGEAQRIRLATQIGSQLTGVLYVLDEPSIGLHPRDNDRLLDSLRKLRDLGNTLIVVEHDEATMRTADWLVDLGPGAGTRGGRLMASATPDRIIQDGQSSTARFLRGEEAIPVPTKRRPIDLKLAITVKGATEHNLKNIDVTFPLGVLTVVCGISGSGKSTVVHDILRAGLQNKIYRTQLPVGAHKSMDGLDFVDKVVEVDQSPIGRTPRSNPATYIGVFSAIRDLFAGLPESQVRGYGPGRFSFNTRGGRCEVCAGDGLIKVEMHFLPDVYVECETCRGKRYNQETLQVTYGGKTIADVLAMTVDEAVEFFAHHRSIGPKLKVLQDVGLGYIRLGQSSTTLSGGEAQRIKLTKELGKRSTGKTVYILDEPTTGLHFEDIRHLLALLQGLVDQGNTVIVIEHNLDVIKSADYLIELGPGGGRYGGQLVAAGPPEKVAITKTSPTGPYIAGSLGITSSSPDDPPAESGKAKSPPIKPRKTKTTASPKEK